VRGIWSKNIQTPHIPLGISLAEALDILKTVDEHVYEEADERETSYKASCESFEVAVYEKGGVVSSVWYNDPTGRLTLFGKKKKISCYLSRYGNQNNWEKRMNNGWITFYFNDSEKVSMAYGNDMDVLRFNLLDE